MNTIKVVTVWGVVFFGGNSLDMVIVAVNFQGAICLSSTRGCFDIKFKNSQTMIQRWLIINEKLFLTISAQHKTFDP